MESGKVGTCEGVKVERLEDGNSSHRSLSALPRYVGNLMSRRPCVGGHKNCMKLIVNSESADVCLVFPATSRYRDSHSDVFMEGFLMSCRGKNRQKHCFLI